MPTFESKIFSLAIWNLEPSSEEMYGITGGLQFDAAECNFPFVYNSFCCGSLGSDLI